MTKRAQVGSALQSIVTGTVRGALALALSLAFVGCEGMVGAGDEENLSRQGQSGAKQVLGGLCSNGGDCGTLQGEQLVCRNQGHFDPKMCLPLGKHKAWCAGPRTQQDGWCKSGTCRDFDGDFSLDKYCDGPNAADPEVKWPDRAVSVPEGQLCRPEGDTCAGGLACRVSVDDNVARCRQKLAKGAQCATGGKPHSDWCLSGQCGCIGSNSNSCGKDEDYTCIGEDDGAGTLCTACHQVPTAPSEPKALDEVCDPLASAKACQNGLKCTEVGATHKCKCDPGCHGTNVCKVYDVGGVPQWGCTAVTGGGSTTKKGYGATCTMGSGTAECQDGLTCKTQYSQYATCECNPGCTGGKTCEQGMDHGAATWSCVLPSTTEKKCTGVDGKEYTKDAWSPYGQCGTGTKCGRAKCKADGTWDTSHCVGGDADADKKCGTTQFCSLAGSCTAKSSTGQCTRPAECTSGKCEPPYGGSSTNYCVNAPAAPVQTDEIDASTFDSRSRKADETCYNTDDCQQGLSCAKHGSEKTCGCTSCSGANDSCELTTTPKVWACNHGQAPAQEPVQAQGQGQTAGDATCPTGRSMPNNPHPVGQHLADGSWVFAAPGKYEMGNIAPGTACDYTCWGKGYAWNEPTPGSWQFCFPDPSAAGGGRFSTPKARGSQSLGDGLALGLDADDALRASEAGVSGSCAVSGSPTQLPAWFALITLLGLVSLLRRRD